MGYVVTAVADRAAAPLTAGVVSALRDALRAGSAEILSAGEAVDLPVAAEPDLAAARAALEGAAVDLIASPVVGRRKRLLIADMDCTMITVETLDEIADFAGMRDRIGAITARAMNGELDFAAALRERLGLLRGQPAEILERTWERVRLTDGGKALVATMRARGAYTALVSGGFTFFTERVAALLGFHTQRANTLLLENGALAGAVAEPILDRDSKLVTLRALAAEHGLGMDETLAVGDGANDLAMLGAAGLGVAFRAKPAVAAAARARVDHADLRSLLFAQGYRAADIVEPG
jgi:phosphoserine phosphatase